jgi:hypothetical protein
MPLHRICTGPCVVPQAGKPTFTLADDEMETGMGIHGEPGIWRNKLKPADETTDAMLDFLLDDGGVGTGKRVSVTRAFLLDRSNIFRPHAGWEGRRRRVQCGARGRHWLFQVAKPWRTLSNWSYRQLRL